MNPFGHSLKEKNMKTLEIEKHLKQGETLVFSENKWMIFVQDEDGNEDVLVFDSALLLLSYIKG